MRSACIAALLAMFATLAHAQSHVDTRPKRVEPALDSSFLDPKPGWSLKAPTTGVGEPKQGVRTIRILPDGSPAPAPPRNYFVQLTTQRTSQEAQDRYEEMQRRFPSALGSRQPVILRTDAGVSVVYRAMVGPFDDLAAANQMCDGLKAQGGQCVVHRLDLEAPGRVEDAPAPRQVENAPADAPAPAGGRYFVQISAQRTEDELRASADALRAKYPGVIGDRALVVRRRDLGEKGGVFYLGQIGPFDTLAAANAFCATLKDAGGQCIVQRAN